MLNVHDINYYITAVFIYKCLHGSLPDLFDHFFITNRVIHGRELRNAEDLHIPHARIDIRRFSIRLHGPQAWNSLPHTLRNCDSINILKSCTRNLIIDRKLEL